MNYARPDRTERQWNADVRKTVVHSLRPSAHLKENRAALKYVKLASRLSCVICLIFYYIFKIEYSIILLTITITTYAMRLVLEDRSTSTEFVGYICLIYLYIVPTISFYVDRSGDPLPLVAATVLFFDCLNRMSQSKHGRGVRIIKRSNINYLGWAIMLISSSVGGSFIHADGSSFVGIFAFTVPFAVSLIFFERIVSSNLINLTKAYAMIFVYAVVIFIYILLYWSGFGRIMIAAYILMPLLILDRYRDFGLRPWQAALAAPFLLALSHLSRYGDWGETKDLAGGSASHHLTLTLDLLKNPVYEHLGGINRFFEQYTLLFLNWFPRDSWPGKPLSLGYKSVDEWIGRTGYGDGYSISLGMYGEQLYLLGPASILSIMLLLATIIVLRRIVVALSRDYEAPSLVFDICLISYVWGGAATFGSRAWFFIVPMLATIAIWGVFDPARKRPEGHHRYHWSRP